MDAFEYLFIIGNPDSKASVEGLWAALLASAPREGFQMEPQTGLPRHAARAQLRSRHLNGLSGWRLRLFQCVRDAKCVV